MSEYASGSDYDAQYSALYEPEIRVLSALAREQGGAVLDLCCGTGIVTMPLADTGQEVVGVDISEAMLAQARAKLGERHNPTFVLEDALEYDPAQRFRLVVMTGNAFQCFLSGAALRALFAKVHALLEAGGIFIFDTRLPEGYDLTLGDYQLWSEYPDAEGKPAQFWVKQAAYDAASGVLRYAMKDVYADGRVVHAEEDLKFTPLKTLLQLADEAGFELLATYKDWQLEPLPAKSDRAVLELKRVAHPR